MNYNLHNRKFLDQLLVNQTHRVLFCLVEKCGNTNVRMLFLIAGHLVPEIIATKSRSEFRKYIQKYNSNLTTGNSLKLNNETIESVIQYYFKMVIIRHPLERLLSAYREKVNCTVSRPEEITDDPELKYSNDLALDIFRKVNSVRYKQWLDNRNMEHRVTFSDFIQFVVDEPNEKLNIHFMPVINLCLPCAVRYNFYGNIKHYNQDAKILLAKLGSKLEDIPGSDHGMHTKETTSILHHSYSQLSQDLKEQLFRDWYSELEFYYYLYPEERNSHKSILNVDEDIPIEMTPTD